MIKTTRIDWPGLSKTINPIVGCMNNCSKKTTGYDCYAKKMSDRFKMIPDFTKPQFFPERLTIPDTVKKPCTWFVGSMCDIFSKGVPADWVLRLISMAERNPFHTFMFLTKNPEFYQWHTWPDNCQLGTTIESKFQLGRYLHMDLLPNKKYLSIEPILSDFTGAKFVGIVLIIVGADSTRGAKIPPLEWILSIKHPNIWYKQNLRKYYPQLINK
jgi:protein gp37